MPYAGLRLDRPVAARVGDGAIDVEGAEGKLGLDEAGLDQRIGTGHLAGKGAERVGIKTVRDDDFRGQQTTERRRDRQLLGMDRRQADSRIGVGMTSHRHGGPPMN